MSTPNNLPFQSTSFIGREREIAEIKQLLATTRLLTLTGTGGSGKTRLSVEVALCLLQDGQYPDGAWFIDLSPIADPTLVFQAMASALGLSEQPGRTLTATLLDHLRDRHMLLVLDNCEHLLASSKALANTLLRYSPHLKILATSRQVLGVSGETTWRVPSLSLPEPNQHLSPESLEHYEAIRLFLERARFRRPDFQPTTHNAQHIAQICYRLDGIPLAIELAAARVSVLSVEQIAARLDHAFRLLIGGNIAAQPRQQTLEALLDWSYDMLTHREQKLLRALSVFAGGFDLDAVVATWDGNADEFEVIELLSQLGDKSLVIAEEREGQVRYRLLETIRQYAWGKLVPSGEATEVQSRSLDWYIALAERAEVETQGPNQLEWLNRLDTEHDNLRAALGWALEGGGEEERGLRLAGALWHLWDKRGYWSEGRERLASALALAGPAATLARAKALSGAGAMARNQGDYEEALKFHEAALQIFQQLEDTRGVAGAYAGLGLVANEHHDPARAGVYYEKGLALYRQLADKPNVVRLLNNWGHTLVAGGDYIHARSLFEEGLVISRQLGHKRFITALLINLGETARLAGDYGSARSIYGEALLLAREISENWLAANALHNLAQVARHQQHYGEATSLFREGLILLREVGQKRDMVVSLAGIAEVIAPGQPGRAATLMGAVEALLGAIDTMLDAIDQASFDSSVTSVRAQLGPTFMQAWESGQAMTLEQAVDLALQPASQLDVPSTLVTSKAAIP